MNFTFDIATPHVMTIVSPSSLTQAAEVSAQCSPIIRQEASAGNRRTAISNNLTLVKLNPNDFKNITGLSIHALDEELQ